MSLLTFKLGDLDGNDLATLHERGPGEVQIGVNESRVAKVEMYTSDKRVQNIIPLARTLKAFYRDALVFHGVILKPNWVSRAGQAGMVEINAHDQSLWWKKNYHRYGDYVVDVGYPFDGRGVQYLSFSAYPTQKQITRGVRHPGIAYGLDLSTHQGPKPADLKNPSGGDGLWSHAERGSNVFETIEQLCATIIGPDWELKPVEPDVAGRTGSFYPATFFNELNLWDKKGSDKSAQVFFQRNFGRNNCDSFEWGPDGDAVINYAVAVSYGGERNAFDPDHRALAHNDASWKTIGIYERWEATGSDPKTVLQAKASAFVKAYTAAPNYFTIEPATEKRPVYGGGDQDPFLYGQHFVEGDIIRAGVKDGYFVQDLKGRVMRVTLSDDGKQKNTTQLTCIPSELDDVGDGGYGDEGG